MTSLKAEQTRLGFALANMLTQLIEGYELESRHVILRYESPYVIERQTTKQLVAEASI